MYNVLREIKLSQVSPKGWLKNFLICEKEGVTGNLDKIGYPFNQECWGYKKLTDGGYEQWWPYEQVGYWIDSVVRSAMLLRDDEFLQKVIEQIEQSLKNAEDGFIGPEELKIAGKTNQWPHAVYFRALTALWSATGDERYILAMKNHYLTGYSDYSGDREIVNIETMLKIYELTSDERMKEMAKKAYDSFNKRCKNCHSTVDYMLSDKIPSEHGVTYNEHAKLAAIIYSVFGDGKYIEAAKNAYKKIDKYHMLVDGIHSSSEATCGNSALHAHETCDIADYTWSIGYMLMATGNGEYADKIERACFNAALGAIGPYFKTIQYFSSPNQVIAARNSTHIEAFANTPRFAFQPHHYPECCVGNVGRIMPNYIARMYMEGDNSVALGLYGESTYKGKDISIVQNTNYPFDDTIVLNVSAEKPVEYIVKLRIPRWCEKYEITLNGEVQNCKVENGFADINAVFNNGDKIVLKLPMEFKAKDSVDGGRYFEYGPFLLALKIVEDWVADTDEKRQTKEFPSYNVYSKSKWNYAVGDVLNVEIIKNSVGANPWWDGYPFEFKIKARTVMGWETVKKEIVKPGDDSAEKIDDKMVELGATEVTDNMEITPSLPSSEYILRNIGEEETITLVPYGNTNVRISVFPKF